MHNVEIIYMQIVINKTVPTKPADRPNFMHNFIPKIIANVQGPEGGLSGVFNCLFMTAVDFTIIFYSRGLFRRDSYQIHKLIFLVFKKSFARSLQIK